MCYLAHMGPIWPIWNPYRPIWAHMGPNGSIWNGPKWAQWAQMGPNGPGPFLIQRAGPGPGPLLIDLNIFSKTVFLKN